MQHPEGDLQSYAAIDLRILGLASKIRILSTLAWPLSHQEKFLAAWRQGRPALPEVTLPRVDYTEVIRGLEQLHHEATGHNPLAHYLRETILSYKNAALMLQTLGTKDFTKYSIALYGKPSDHVKGAQQSNVAAARHFIKIADKFWRVRDPDETNYCITPQAIQADLKAAVDQVFTRHKVDVTLDKSMASKAAAGTRRIRIRQGTTFGPYDFNQLLQHEAFVHTLTGINGAEQPYLKTFGAGAPRTTATQEGLATFAELVTGAMDIGRLKRIALRIIAVEMGLSGADFIDVFRFFLEAGQSESESFSSTMRVFRGGSVKGGIVFTKDTVYLSGLLSCHAFLREAMHQTKLKYTRYLFCGRLTFDDAVQLEPYFASGFIAEPVYLPQWLENDQSLAAYLAFSLFADRISVPQHSPGTAMKGRSGGRSKKKRAKMGR